MRRAFLYSYVLTKHYELKFSGVASDVFSRIREGADSAIGRLLPQAVQKFSAVYDNLSSSNPEDWSNAAHSCRRILQALADALFPATEPRVIKGKSINLGADSYINRLICFAEDHSNSKIANQIIGSHLHFLGDRLDSLFAGAQKGSHTEILDRSEADRIVVYTYLLVSDILALAET